MNTFSIAVSRRLKEIGVEEETGFFYDRDGKIINESEYFIGCARCGAAGKIMPPRISLIPVYTLHDILRIMPKIGEKMGWKVTPLGTQYFYIFQNDCEYPLETLCARFREGDYEKAEIYLLDLLKEHA